MGLRLILNAVEGWGKTSCVSHAPNPAIIMIGGETGYQTLLSAGRVPSVDAVRVTTWPELMGVVDDCIGGKYGVLGIDALGGAERALHEHVCQRDFAGDWGERGFLSFHKGYEQSVGDWLTLLAKLDRVRETGTHIVLLSHCKVTTFKNPLGADYDKYVADCHAKTWGVSHKWADAVLFGTFYSVIEKNRPGDQKGKAKAGVDRVLYTEHRDAYDAKNRFGLPDCIDIPDDPSAIWSTIHNSIFNKEQSDASAV
jgi:hypothetical protein